jgi:hypothetical protein
MKLEFILTLANKKVELRFLAMVRSLRAVGCNLPVLVIPYDNNRIELPDNCEYVENTAFYNWLNKYPMSGVKRKYLALTLKNYHFVDSDVIFLRDPNKIFSTLSGFVTCCGHWRSGDHIVTNQLVDFLQLRSSLWQKLIFNSGQFACDSALYQEAELMTLCESNSLLFNTLECPSHEQPGLNHLVHASNIPYTNLTLPPYDLESSWAGDYPNGFIEYNADKSPYLMHWAGMQRGNCGPIDQLFLHYLTKEERERLYEEEKNQVSNNNITRRIKNACRAFLREVRTQT